MYTFKLYVGELALQKRKQVLNEKVTVHHIHVETNGKHNSLKVTYSIPMFIPGHRLTEESPTGSGFNRQMFTRPNTRSSLASASQHRHSLGGTVDEVMQRKGTNIDSNSGATTMSSYKPSFFAPSQRRKSTPIRDLEDINEALEKRLVMKRTKSTNEELSKKTSNMFAKSSLSNNKVVSKGTSSKSPQSKHKLSLGMAQGPMLAMDNISASQSRFRSRQTNFNGNSPNTKGKLLTLQTPKCSEMNSKRASLLTPPDPDLTVEDSWRQQVDAASARAARRSAGRSPSLLATEDSVDRKDNYFHFPSPSKSSSGASEGANTLALDNWVSNYSEGALTTHSSSSHDQSNEIQNVKPARHRDSVDVIDDVEDASLMAHPKQSHLPEGKASQLPGEPFTLELATSLRTLIFGSLNKTFSQGWLGQSFNFTSNEKIRFGLVQDKGGPCGVLASVQAHLLQALIFGIGDDLSTRAVDGLKPTNHERQRALAASLVWILVRIAKQTKPEGPIVLTLPALKQQFTSLGRYKSDGVTEMLQSFSFSDRKSAMAFALGHINYFENQGSSAVIAFLYSALLTRGVLNVTKDMDSEDLPLMGAHGYCSQEMVNLLLTGRAVSNTFDGKMSLDSTELRGVEARSDIGLLSLFEHYKSCVVGENLKTPKYPIWLVCSESHFTVLFSETMGNERTVAAERHPITTLYYDPLARQDKLIVLTINCHRAFRTNEEPEDDLASPLEHCIRTKWREAFIDWNGSERIL